MRNGVGGRQQWYTAKAAHGDAIVEGITGSDIAVSGYGCQEVTFCVGKSQEETHLDHTFSRGDGLSLVESSSASRERWLLYSKHQGRTRHMGVWS